MEQKKISLKNLYLIAIISIGLIGLGVGSTFAMFTASVEIDNPISLTYNIDYYFDVLETADVELAPGERKTITMNVTNDTDYALNYTFWYINEGGYDLDFGIVDGNGNNVSTGIIPAGGGPLTYYISVRNKTNGDANVVIGLSSSGDSVVFSDEMVIIPSSSLPPVNGITMINSIFVPDSTMSETTNKTYDIDTNHMLMKINNDNIRYFGSSPNNYIYFNCTTYPSTSCEKWRIIGIVDGRIKLIRNSSIGAYSYDTSASTVNSGSGINQWGTTTNSSGTQTYGADIRKLIGPGFTTSPNNSLYYNGSNGNCYTDVNDTYSSCDFRSSSATPGFKNDTTRSLIAKGVRLYTGGVNGTSGTGYSKYPSDFFEKERGTELLTNPSDGYTRTASFINGASSATVGIPYPSDYGYATDFRYCSNCTMDKYKSDDASCSTCLTNNWIKSILNTGLATWTITPYSTYATREVSISASGYITYSTTSAARNVVPVIYLETTQMISGGSGTITDPYQLYVSN